MYLALDFLNLKIVKWLPSEMVPDESYLLEVMLLCNFLPLGVPKT